MSDLRLMLWQAAAGTVGLAATGLILGFGGADLFGLEWDGPLVALTFVAAGSAAIAGFLAVLSKNWVLYSILAGVWMLATVAISATLAQILFAPAIENAGPAGMVFIMPFVVFVFALPFGLLLRLARHLAGWG